MALTQHKYQSFVAASFSLREFGAELTSAQAKACGYKKFKFRTTNLY
jgi:hypothetical protein